MALTVLVVDNDQVNSFVLKNIITKNYPGAEVSLFGDAQSALSSLDEAESKGLSFPNILLLDIYMPGLDGFGFLEAYSSKYAHKQTVIFAMSSSLVKEDQQKANSFPIVKGFITKPLIYNNIQFIVDTYVEGLSDG